MAAVGRRLPYLLFLLPSLLPIFCLDGEAAEEGGGLRPSSPGDNGDPTGPDPVPTAEPQFALKVLVLDSVTHQPLPGVSVSVYLNYSVTSSDQTEPSGEAVFWIRHRPQLALTLLADKRGYVPQALPWSSSRRPVLSVVTLLLLPQTQGNIWLFEDSVLITGTSAGSSYRPTVAFPRSLILTSNISSVTAYVTAPRRPPLRDCSNCAPGLLSSGSAASSVDLSPAASVSILLFCGDQQLQVRGPLQISLPLPAGLPLRAGDTVPAWNFNFNTGAWENQGLGLVKAHGDELLWTYTASHLGHWMAAPLPSPESWLGYKLSLDLLWFHTNLLMGALGATLLLLLGFLSLLVYHCRRSQEPRRRTARFTKLTVLKKDQTTSTHLEAGLLYRPGDSGVQGEASSGPRPNASYNIYVEEPGNRPADTVYENLPPGPSKCLQPPLHYVKVDEAARHRDEAEPSSAMSNVFFPEKLINIFSQAVAVVQAPELLSSCKAATFPRKGGEYDAHPHPEPTSTDAFAQMLAKGSVSSPRQGSQNEPRALERPPPGQEPSAGGWGHYSTLLESSVSVPGTLNEAAGLEAFGGVTSELQGLSERTLAELARGKPLLSHPRAWFVSLDGKPAAQVRHSIIELQSRQRPPSSNDTSLDSGVDMNEPVQHVRDTDRDRPFARASSLSRHSQRGGRGSEEQDLSSSESGTTAACTPEEPALRSILDGSCGAVPNIPEEHEDTEMASTREDGLSREPALPSRRLRKMKVKSDCKQTREGRLHSKRS